MGSTKKRENPRFKTIRWLKFLYCPACSKISIVILQVICNKWFWAKIGVESTFKWNWYYLKSVRKYRHCEKFLLSFEKKLCFKKCSDGCFYTFKWKSAAIFLYPRPNEGNITLIFHSPIVLKFQWRDFGNERTNIGCELEISQCLSPGPRGHKLKERYLKTVDF